MSRQLLENTLHEIADLTGAQAVCVAFSDPTLPDANLFWSESGLMDDAMSALICDRLRLGSYPENPQLINRPANECPLDDTPFRCSFLVPLSGESRVLGILALLCTHSDCMTEDGKLALSSEAQTAFDLRVELLRLTIENRMLNATVEESLAAAQSIFVAAQAIAEDPIPQRLVNILVQTVCGEHISACALLLYEPASDDTSPFETLRVAGTWERSRGSGIGVSMRLKSQRYATQLEKIHHQRQTVIHNIPARLKQLDPFVTSFVREAEVNSATVIALQSASRYLGLIAFATRDRHEFSPQELLNYRTVAEFVSLSLVALLTQQQRSRELRGRATLLDSITDGVMFVSSGRGPGGTIRMANDCFTSWFGLEEGEAVGMNMQEMLERMHIPEEVRVGLREQWLGPPVSDPATWNGEFTFTLANGQSCEITWYSAPVYERGEFEGSVIGRMYIFTDVTADRAAARLRAAFIARASHELRTPLQSIQGFAEVILSENDPAIPSMVKEYTEIILNSARRLGRMVNDMIDITRVDAGELKLRREGHHLPDLLLDIASQMEVHYRERNQRLVLDFDDTMPWVEIDYDRMLQVLTNLIANAIKYSPRDTTITLSAQVIRDYAQLEGIAPNAPTGMRLPAALLTLRDQGAGLDAENADKVFVPFFRTEDSKRKRIEGAGLGLAVTRSIVEAHGGKIWAVPNPPANGGCFMVLLPLATAALPAQIH